jgi:hypothetical protein
LGAQRPFFLPKESKELISKERDRERKRERKRERETD